MKETKEAKKNIYSYSSLQSAQSCLGKYFFEHSETKKTEKQSIYGIFGKALHKTLEECFKKLQKNEKLDFNEYMNNLENEWNQVFDEVFSYKDIEVISEQQKIAFRKKGLRILRRSLKKLKEQGYWRKPFLVEKRFVFPIKKLNAEIHGRIDLVFKNKNSIEILDFKSSTFTDNFAKDSKQLLLYALVLKILLKREYSSSLALAREEYKTISDYSDRFANPDNRYSDRFANPDNRYSDSKEYKTSRDGQRLDKNSKYINTYIHNTYTRIHEQKLLKKMKISLYFLRNNHLDYWNVDRRDYIKVWKWVVKNIKKIREEKIVYNLDPRNCYFCQYKKTCPAYSQSALQMKIPKFDKFVGNLRDFQKKDSAFMLERKVVLNANEMGLGKTVESIAVFSHLENKKILIVCPNSLKYQWKDEIKYFLKRKVIIIKDVDDLSKLYSRKNEFIAIINYEKIIIREKRKKGEKKKKRRWHREKMVLKKNFPIDWDIIVLDEASYIKSRVSKVSDAIKMLKAEYKFALTGTPIENRLEELFSIFEFLDPRVFGNWWGFDKRYIIRQEPWHNVIGYKNIEEIQLAIRPYLIRHRTEEVQKDLPELIKKNLFVEMTNDQKRLHKIIWEELEDAYIKYINEQSKINAIYLLSKISHARKLCDSPELITHLKHNLKRSEKLDELERLMTMIKDQGRKVLIFSSFEKMISLIEEKFKKKFRMLRFTGKEGAEERERAKKLFMKNKDYNFLLLTDAGKFGLNLQSATYVINVDLPWTPAVLEQRIKRAHRTGQKFPVIAINLITKNSLEERILQKLHLKHYLASTIIDLKESDNLGITSLKKEDLKDLIFGGEE